MLAATSEDLTSAIRMRRFREDLYHRLAVVTVQLPPLRDRGSDVLLLARHYLDRACREYGLPGKMLSSDAEAALLAYTWPGNVRELERLMERTVALSASEVVEIDDLPPKVRGEIPVMMHALGHDRTMRAWGSRYARVVLERCGGNKREACRTSPRAKR